MPNKSGPERSSSRTGPGDATMPTRANTPCRAPGCPTLVPRGYCPAHTNLDPRAERQRALDARRGSSSARGYGGRWRRLREAVLNRDPFCRLRTKCKGSPSTEVDHIIAKRNGGTDHESNLQGVCKACHSHKTAHEVGFVPTEHGYTTPVVVVCGPPGAGKSSFVLERARWGELVVDYDALMHAMSGLPSHERPANLRPFVEAARDSVLALIGIVECPRAWVIATGATRAARNMLRMRFKRAVTVVVLETSPTECWRRVKDDPERGNAEAAGLRDSVDSWWRKYERDERDDIVHPTKAEAV